MTSTGLPFEVSAFLKTLVLNVTSMLEVALLEVDMRRIGSPIHLEMSNITSSC